MKLENIDLGTKGLNNKYNSTITALSNIPKIIDENFSNIVDEIINTKEDLERLELILKG